MTMLRSASSMHSPCGMLLSAVSKRWASSDMSREAIDRIEQGAAQPLGNELDGDEERDEQAGERPVVQACRKQQRGGHSAPPRRTDLHDHEGWAAEIPPEDADHVGDRHREAHELRERIGGAREGDETPDAEQPDRGRPRP